jgi:hypothetical protein
MNPKSLPPFRDVPYTGSGIREYSALAATGQAVIIKSARQASLTLNNGFDKNFRPFS